MLRWTVPLLLVVFCGTAPAQQGRYSGSRPHSVAAIRDRDGVAITRLRATTRLAGGRVEVRMVLDAHLRRGTPRSAYVHVLSCTGTGDYPTCRTQPPPRKIALRRQSSTTRATVRVAVPPPSTDVVVVTAVMWSVSSQQPARVRWECTVGTCGGTSFRLKGDGHRNGEGPLDRSEIEPEGSPTLGMVGTTGDRRLFSVRVPTPIR